MPLSPPPERRAPHPSLCPVYDPRRKSGFFVQPECAGRCPGTSAKCTGFLPFQAPPRAMLKAVAQSGRGVQARVCLNEARTMKLLITGGAGFIGSHLCRRLLATSRRRDGLLLIDEHAATDTVQSIQDHRQVGFRRWTPAHSARHLVEPGHELVQRVRLNTPVHHRRELHRLADARDQTLTHGVHQQGQSHRVLRLLRPLSSQTRAMFLTTRAVVVREGPCPAAAARPPCIGASCW